MGYVNSLEGMHVLISCAYLCYFVIFTQELVLRQHQSFVDASPEGKKVSARLVPGEDFVEMDPNIFIISQFSYSFNGFFMCSTTGTEHLGMVKYSRDSNFH